MSNLLQMYEDEIIMKCVKRLKDINVEVCTLCFDGFLIKGVHTSDDILLFLKSVTDEMGYEMEWAYKEHTLLDVPETNVKEEYDEKAIADIFKNEHKDTLLVGDTMCYEMNEITGIFTKYKDKKERVRKLLMDEMSDNHIIVITLV